MITCTINCILLISCKSSAIFSSPDILIVNRGGNVLLIGFSLVDGMPELLVFKCHKHCLHCLSVSYKEYDQCYHKYNVTCKCCIGEHDQQDLPHMSIMYIFQKLLFIPYVIFLGFESCNVLCIGHVYQYVL